MRNIYVVIKQPTGGKNYVGAYEINVCHYIIKYNNIKQCVSDNYKEAINKNIYPPIYIFNKLIKNKKAYSYIDAINKCKQLNKQIYENSKRAS